MSEEIAALRTVVADMPPAPEAMARYLAKVRERAYTVTDADVEQLRADGFTERSSGRPSPSQSRRVSAATTPPWT